MPALPKSIFHLGAALLTKRAARRLRGPDHSLAAQAKTRLGLAAQMARTTFGQSTGIETGQSYDSFRARVPLQTYEQIRPLIERMKRGEPNVLWPGTCAYYAVSSGTTAGRTKYLPITPAMLAHFRKAGLDSLLYYTARIGNSRVFRGRHLFLGGATTLTPIPESKPFEAFAGDLSGITALNLPGWADQHLYEPGLAIAQMSDWPAKIDAVVERTWNRNITLIGGIPSWILILSEHLLKRGTKAGRAPKFVQDLWPHLECLIHGGVPIDPFADELRATLGPAVNFHEIYPASEAFIAAQDAAPALGLRLLSDAGIFYEFLPMSDFNEAGLASLGTKAVPLEGVQIDQDYALIMTTPGGLARYVIGDIVRFISTRPPRLIYAGRTQLQLSAFGEHVIEKELTDTLAAVARTHGWQIVNFHVAPVFANAQSGERRGRHEWWIELRPGVGTPPAPSIIAAEADADLQQRNEDYEAKRKGGGLEVPVIRLVPSGTFEKWLRLKGKWGGQNKTPRCRSDREIADQLAGLTRPNSGE